MSGGTQPQEERTVTGSPSGHGNHAKSGTGGGVENWPDYSDTAINPANPQVIPDRIHGVQAQIPVAGSSGHAESPTSGGVGHRFPGSDSAIPAGGSRASGNPPSAGHTPPPPPHGWNDPFMGYNSPQSGRSTPRR
jgi:hypothetical protein